MLTETVVFVQNNNNYILTRNLILRPLKRTRTIEIRFNYVSGLALSCLILLNLHCRLIVKIEKKKQSKNGFWT